MTIGSLLLGYDLPGANFQFINRNNELFMAADRAIEIRSMTGGEPEVVNAHDTIQVQPMHLYAIDSYQLIVKKYYPHAVLKVEKDPTGNSAVDAVTLEVTDGSNKQLVSIMGHLGMRSEPVLAKVGNSTVEFEYGQFDTYRSLVMLNLLDKKHFLSKEKENFYVAGE